MPPAVFVRYHLVTAENVDHFYPNDALLGLVPVPCDPVPPADAAGVLGGGRPLIGRPVGRLPG